MNGLYYNVRVRVKGKNVDGRDYFGRGVADLLHGVKEYHSLNQATKEMGMAYSKAWRIVRQAEKTLGMPLLVRMGKNGSVLTPDGENCWRSMKRRKKKPSGWFGTYLKSITGKDLEKDAMVCYIIFYENKTCKSTF